MAAASSTQDGETSRSRAGARSGRNGTRSGGFAPFAVTLFFVFVLTYLAIFLVMLCTAAATLGGMLLLALALTLTIAGYVAGA